MRQIAFAIGMLCACVECLCAELSDAQLNKLFQECEPLIPQWIKTKTHELEDAKKKLAAAQCAVVNSRLKKSVKTEAGFAFATAKDKQDMVDTLRQSTEHISGLLSLLKEGKALPYPTFTGLTFRVGDIGRFPAEVSIEQVLGPKEARVRYGQDFILSNYDTSKIADGAKCEIISPVVFTGTRTYTTALDAARTVLVCEPLEWSTVVQEWRKRKAKK